MIDLTPALRFIDELEELSFKVDAAHHASQAPMPNAVEMREHLEAAYDAMRDALEAAREHVRQMVAS